MRHDYVTHRHAIMYTWWDARVLRAVYSMQRMGIELWSGACRVWDDETDETCTACGVHVSLVP